MALAAVFRLARPSRREVVATVASGAGAARAVEVQAPDPRIRPGARIHQRLAILVPRDSSDRVQVRGPSVGVRHQTACFYDLEKGGPRDA